MFKNLALLVMAFMFLNGCSAMQNSERIDSAHVYYELVELNQPFVASYGERGMNAWFRFDNSPEELANFEILLTEPGFVISINSDVKKAGVEAKVEKIFNKAGYNLQKVKERKVCEQCSWLQMNFVKFNKTVFFDEK